jgi:hypothetical protein
MEIGSALESYRTETPAPTVRTLQLINGDWAVLVADEIVLWLNRDHFRDRTAVLAEGLAEALKQAA